MPPFNPAPLDQTEETPGRRLRHEAQRFTQWTSGRIAEQISREKRMSKETLSECPHLDTLAF